MSAKAPAADGDDPELARLNAELESALAEAALDVAGILDPTPISDSIAAARSFSKGEYVDAALSLISIIPYAGDALGKTAKGARLMARINKIRARIARRLAELADRALNASKARSIIKRAQPFGHKLVKAIEQCPKKVGQMTGMLPEAAEAVIKACDEVGVQVVFRDTNPDSLRWLKQGHPPKPRHLKMKTIKEADEWIGGPVGARGQVGYFKPDGDSFEECLDRLKKRDPKAFELVSNDKDRMAEMKRRYDQRTEEFNDYEMDIEKYKKSRKKGILVEGGVVKDAKSGKAYTGDHDMYEVLDLDGKPLPKGDRRVEVIQKKLQEPPVNAQHDAHKYWDTEGKFENEKIKQEIIDEHREKGGLTIIGPGGAVKAKAPPVDGTYYLPSQ